VLIRRVLFGIDSVPNAKSWRAEVVIVRTKFLTLWLFLYSAPDSQGRCAEVARFERGRLCNSP